MDIGTIGTFAVALFGLLIALLFGSQYGGILPWWRNRRTKRGAAVAEGAPPSQSLQVTELPQAGEPVPAAPEAEPLNVKISQILVAKNQPRAAHWALVLPVLIYSIAWLVFIASILIMLLGSVFSPLDSILMALSTKLVFASLFLFVLAIWSPSIVLYVAAVALSLRALMKP